MTGLQWGVIVVFAMGFLAAIHSWLGAQSFPDEFEYWTLAKSLVNSGSLALNGEAPSAYRPPFLAFVLAPLAAIGSSMEAARVWMVAFYLLSGLAVILFVNDLRAPNRLLPSAAAFLVLGHPAYFYSAGNLYPQTLLTPLLLGALLLFWRLPIGWQRSAGIGLLSGASALTAASSIFAFLPLYVAAALIDLREIIGGRRSRAYNAFVMLFVSALVVAPYLYRNHANVHPGVYLSLNSGITLFAGNAPDTGANTGVDIDWQNFQPAVGLSEFDLNQYYARLAKENIEAAPLHYGKLFLLKALNGFNNSATTFSQGSASLKSVILWLFALVLWGLATLGITAVFHPQGFLSQRLGRGQLIRLRGLAIIIVSAYILNILGYAIFFTRLRFRLPCDAALGLVACLGLVALDHAFREWRSAARMPAVER